MRARRVLASSIRVSACCAVVAQHGSHLAPSKSTADLASQWSQRAWKDNIWKLLTHRKAFLNRSISGRPIHYYRQCFCWGRRMTVDTQNGSSLLEPRENQLVHEKILWVSNPSCYFGFGLILFSSVGRGIGRIQSRLWPLSNSTSPDRWYTPYERSGFTSIQDIQFQHSTQTIHPRPRPKHRSTMHTLNSGAFHREEGVGRREWQGRPPWQRTTAGSPTSSRSLICSTVKM